MVRGCLFAIKFHMADYAFFHVLSPKTIIFVFRWVIIISKCLKLFSNSGLNGATQLLLQLSFVYSLCHLPSGPRSCCSTPLWSLCDPFSIFWFKFYVVL